MRFPAAALVVAATGASAHTIFQEVYVNGVAQGHTTGIRVPTYDGVSHICIEILSLD